jgi:hypothetical protein
MSSPNKLGYSKSFTESFASSQNLEPVILNGSLGQKTINVGLFGISEMGEEFVDFILNGGLFTRDKFIALENETNMRLLLCQ